MRAFYQKTNLKKLLISTLVLPTFAIAGCNAGGGDSTVETARDVYDFSELDVAFGKQYYARNCVSCHGRKLEGAAGFNLVDSVWVHGETVEEISLGIANGFPEAGMPGFEGVLKPKQIDQVSKFILSKREGWDTLTYKIYPVEENTLADFSILETTDSIASGKLRDGLADFSIAEVPFFAMTLEGAFNAPWDQPSSLLFEELGWIMNNDKSGLKVEVDGEELATDKGDGWDGSYRLKPGSQHVRISYFISAPAEPNADWSMWHSSGRIFAVREDLSSKHAPLSVKAKTVFEDTAFKLVVDDTPRVTRIKTLDLPTYSINVGFPNQINYAFNSRSCSIVGMWMGEFLNIGPNISGRGKEASEALGEWIFRSPDDINLTPSETKDARCKLKKYTRGDAPAFYFEKEGQAYRLTGRPDSGGLSFDLAMTKSAARTFNADAIILPAATSFKIQSLSVPNAAADDAGYTVVQRVVLTPNTAN